VVGEDLDPLGHAALTESLLDDLLEIIAVSHTVLIPNVRG